MNYLFCFLIVLLFVAFSIISYFCGYVYGRTSEGKTIEKPVLRKKKPPDPKAEAMIDEYNRQLYNIEHYTGSADGMKKKGGA